MVATTPSNPPSKEVLRFCWKLSKLTPMFVKYTDIGQPYGVSQCHIAVAHAIKHYGGSRQYGWIIWEGGMIELEAEFHCLWRKPDGTLLDITPRVDGEEEIMFVPDNKIRASKGNHPGSMLTYFNHIPPGVPHVYGNKMPKRVYLNMPIQNTFDTLTKLEMTWDEFLDSL